MKRERPSEDDGRADVISHMWGFPKIRVPFNADLYNKVYSIWGSILGSPCLWKLPHT